MKMGTKSFRIIPAEGLGGSRDKATMAKYNPWGQLLPVHPLKRLVFATDRLTWSLKMIPGEKHLLVE